MLESSHHTGLLFRGKEFRLEEYYSQTGTEKTGSDPNFLWQIAAHPNFSPAEIRVWPRFFRPEPRLQESSQMSQNRTPREKLEVKPHGAIVIDLPMVRNFSTGGGHGPEDTLVEGDEKIVTKKWQGYPPQNLNLVGKPLPAMPATIMDVLPATQVFINSLEPRCFFGCKGFAETAIGAPPGCLSNAIYNACGVRIREHPITKEKILAGLKAKAGRG
jgi:hypothetical protein